MTPLTTEQAATSLAVSPKKVRDLAREVGVGYLVGGRSGWFFSAEEVERMRDAMRPAPVPARRRKRRIT